MQVEAQTTIAVATEVAFDCMADVRNETSWNSQVSRAELRSGEPVGRGTIFVTTNRGRDYEATITTFDRPGRLVFDVRGDRMDMTASFAFAAEDGGTRLAGVFDLRPKGVMRLLLPLLLPAVRRDQAKQWQSFGAFCESAAGPRDER